MLVPYGSTATLCMRGCCASHVDVHLGSGLYYVPNLRRWKWIPKECSTHPKTMREVMLRWSSQVLYEYGTHWQTNHLWMPLANAGGNQQSQCSSTSPQMTIELPSHKRDPVLQPWASPQQICPSPGRNSPCSRGSSLEGWAKWQRPFWMVVKRSVKWLSSS